MRTLIGAVALFAALSGPPARGAEPAARPDLATVDVAVRPWSGIGRINNSAYGRCSAVLVRPDIALTAAHCLYNPASRRFLQPASIHILFGFSKGRYGFHTTVAEITIPEAYGPGGDAASAPDDWAVLRLAARVPDAFSPLALAEPDDAAPRSVRAAGFGQERSEVLTATGPCAVLGSPGEALLVTRCRLSHGFSGGPMIDVGSGKLVGISVAVRSQGGESTGIGVPVSAVSAALPPL